MTSRGLLLYTLVWSVMGGSALGYTLAVLVAPELVGQYLPAYRPMNTGTEISSDFTVLRETVGKVEGDVARLKTDVADHGERSAALETRVASIEAQPPPALAPESAARPASPSIIEPAVTAELNAADSPQLGPLALGTRFGAPEDGPSQLAAAPAALPPAAIEPPSQSTIPVKSLPLAGNQPVAVLNAAEPPKPVLETGSVSQDKPKAVAAKEKPVAPTVVALGPAVIKPVVPPKPKATGIRIGTGPSVDALRLDWLQLSDRHGSALSGLQGRYVTSKGSAGQAYDLLAGPLKSPADAEQICRQLATDGVPCAVATFNGNAL